MKALKYKIKYTQTPINQNIMKQSIYQKLLLSLAFMAFLGTMVSAQVLSRDQVNPTQIHSKQQMMTDLKVKAQAQGLKEIPQAWIDEAVQQQRTERMSARKASIVKPKPQPEVKVMPKLSTLNMEKKPQKKALQIQKAERALVKKGEQNIYERAKQITPPPGYKVGIHTVGGKQYIEFMELPDQGTMTPARVKN